MAVIKTIEKGESLTFGFVLPETYNLANLQAVKIYIGSSIYEHEMDGRTVRVELESNQTALITGRNIVHFVIDDAAFGIKKINCGELEVLPTQATHKDESINTGYDVEIVLSINVETVSVGSVLYDTLKGDKGDAGTIEVGTVTTGNAGTDVIIENVGTPSEAVLNFTIPRGSAGYTPYIGENGNWFINGVDTGVQAEGDATQQWVTDNFVEKETGKSLISDTLISKVTELSPLFWDEDNNTFSFPVPDGGTIQIGQEPHDYYTNLQGAQIVNGDIVSVVGATGNRTAIALTDATNDAKALACFGMVTVATIGSNNVGRITKSGGKVRGVNTSGYAEGATIYVDPLNPGKWTGVKPTAPLRAIQIGVVSVSHAVEGVIELFIKVYPRFGELADVDGATTDILDAETVPVKKIDGLIKFLSWSNIKATLKTYFDTLYEKLANKQNSLAVDGTGKKYPTIDAVNAALTLKADSIDLVEAKQSISTLENVLSDANINQEARVTASGVDTISLPKTAANTGMSVQLFGQSAQNLVVNGDFEVDLSGWTATAAVTRSSLQKKTGSYSMRQNTISNTSRGIYYVGGITGDKFYFSCYMMQTSGTDFQDLGVYINSYGINRIGNVYGKERSVWHKITGTYTAPNNNIYIMLGQASVNTTYEVFFDSVQAINLTATFGAGNEPTKEQCDILFANYFEGSKNVLGTGRIRSVNSTGLNPSYLYFNGGQLRSNGLIKDEIRKGTNGYELVKRVGVGTLGSELITNEADREFTSDTGFWTIRGESTITNGVLNILSTTGSLSGILKYGLLNPGQYYLLEFEITRWVSSSLSVEGASFTPPLPGTTTVGVKRYIIQANASTFVLKRSGGVTDIDIDRISLKPITTTEVVGDVNAVVLGSSIHYTLATPVITPIAHAGLLNSNSNGTAYFEPIIADAGVYSTNLAIQLTDYPIASLESIRKYANGTYTELNPATAVIASGGLSFTHPDLVSGDLVMFTYAYNMESIGRSMTLTHYDNRYVKVDTANGKTYRIDFVVTNGVVVPTATEV